MNLSELVSPGRIKRGLWWQKALNLVAGCTPVSEACLNCWSAEMAHRQSMRQGISDYQWNLWGGLTTDDGRWTGEIRLLEENLSLPLKVKKPTLWSVWNDLFHPDVPDDFIYEFLSVAASSKHFFLILTKRPERAYKVLYEEKQFAQLLDKNSCEWIYGIPGNIGLGVTVELPKYMHRIKTLLQIPAALHFVSLEPLLDELGLRRYFYGHHSYPDSNGTEDCIYNCGAWMGPYRSGSSRKWDDEDGFGLCPNNPRPQLDWVILGCESGHKRRPMKARWAELLIRECKQAEVPVFFKQIERWGKVVHAPIMTNEKPLLQFPEVEWTL